MDTEDDVESVEGMLISPSSKPEGSHAPAALGPSQHHGKFPAHS